jgi:RNA polymerase sigma factor (sigma-70 family)
MISYKVSENPASYVRRARLGDMGAFVAIVKNFQKMAYCYAHSILRDGHLAEDAVQEAFVEAYGKLDRLRDVEAFPGWLRFIVKKHCDRLTRRKAHPVIPADESIIAASGTEDPAAQLEKKDEKQKILTALGSLTENQRIAVSMFYIDGYSQSDIANFLGIAVSSVKKRLFDARRSLREILKTEKIMNAEQTITGLFKNKVSDKIYEKMMNNPEMIKLKGEMREMTVLFSDLNNFTPVLEQHPPEMGVTVLNEYFDAMTAITIKWDGMVANFVGDSIFCFWGSPFSQPESVRNACFAALEMAKATDLLAQEWKARGLPEILNTFGINTGPMVIGNLGSSEFMQYTPLGYAMYFGSMLERYNKEYGTRILISEFTKNYLNGDFSTKEVGSKDVRFHKTPVKIYELQGKHL